MKRSSVTSALLGSTLAATLGLAACGGSPTSTEPAAPAVTSAATSSTAATTGPVDAVDLGKRMTAAMVAAKSGKATMTTSAQGMSLSSTSSFVYTSPTSANVVGTSSIGGIEIETRVVDRVAYIKGMPTAMTGGKPWVKFDGSGTDALSQQLKQAGSGDPQQLVKVLEGGTATVVSSSGGTTEYKVTGVSVQGAPDLTMNITVDDKDLPVTSVVTTQGADVKVAYSDWGTPVTVQAPPADQVGTFSAPS